MFKNLLIKCIPLFATYIYFNTISPLVYHIFSQRVIYIWGKGWCTVPEWLVTGVSGHWGHALVLGNPGYDGVQGLTLPMSWGPSAAWWSSCPGSVFPGMGPWSWWVLRPSAPGPGRGVWLIVPLGLMASSQMSCARNCVSSLVFIHLSWLTIGAKHAAAQVRRGGSVSMGETQPQNACPRSCVTISTLAVISFL